MRKNYNDERADSMVKRNTTLKDIALSCGVSIKTASRAINGEAGVSKATMERVRVIAKELGYVPNIIAKQLASKRSNVLVMIYCYVDGSWINDVQRGAIETAISHGYELIMRPAHNPHDIDADKILRLYDQGSVDGVLVTSPFSSAAIVDVLYEAGVPCVQLSPKRDDFRYPAVFSNTGHGACQLVEYLISLGHRDIGFIKGVSGESGAEDRYLGYCRAMENNGLAINKDWVMQGDYTFRSGLVSGRTLLKRKPRPTAIFASNDEMASGVLSAAHQLGLEVPEEISVAGADDVKMASQLWPPLTTVRQPSAEMASLAVEMLIYSLENPLEKKQEARELPAELILRESTVCPKFSQSS